MTDSLKQRLARGERQLGCILLLPSPEIAEIVGLAGVDVVMIDHEHGGGGLADFVAQARALQASRTRAIVRIPHGQHAYAQRLLDNGARGIVFPGIDTAEEAAACVRACRYPPRGVRGAGAGLRGAAYGFDDAYYTPEAEDDILMIVQIESAAAVANIDAICAVPGVDMLLIGPRDLSASIGKLGRFDDPEVWELVGHAADRIRSAGKFLASTLHPGRAAADMFAAGYDLVLATKDVDFVVDGARALVQSR